MKKISITTNYWLFKRIENTKYYYIRIENQLMPEDKFWILGYVNDFGGVNTVEPSFDENKSVELEKEFQEEINEK